MGVVYAAYDPQLDRKVAIKLLHSSRVGSEGNFRARLIREAQVLAKLNHPNVVTVHDVGEHAGRVFLAMEFVEGPTISQWLAEASRTHAEVLQVFLAAGRGIAAAHSQGLVHRDIKPDNIMIDASGRVRVMDFGLARALTGALEESAQVDEVEAVATLSASDDSLATPLTRDGTVVGTPGYIAPEQAGGQMDERTDQFAFCVALYEALYGHRPFRSAAMLSGEYRLRDTPSGTSVPSRVRRAVMRGLERKPEDRWPSMETFLAEIASDPGQRLRRLTLVAVATLAAGGGLWAASRGEPSVCEEMSRHLEGVWDPTVKREVQAAMDATKLPYAEATWQRVEDRLDAYTGAWVTERHTACHETQVSGEQSESMLDQRMACLDERLSAVSGLADVLRQADASVVDRAVATTSKLPSLESCSPATLVARSGNEELEPNPRRSPLRNEIARARVTLHAGKYARAAELIEPVVEEADQDPSLRRTLAKALMSSGAIATRVAEYDKARADLERAYFLGAESNDTALLAETASHLIYLGYAAGKNDEGLAWVRHGMSFAAATGDPYLKALLLGSVGTLNMATGEYDTAINSYDEAIRIRREQLGQEGEGVATLLHNLGSAYRFLGKRAESRTALDEALAIRRETIGDKHPLIGTTLQALGNLDYDEGDFEAAGKRYEEALAVAQANGETGKNLAAQVHVSIGNVLSERGDLEGAKRHQKQSLKLYEETVGAEHPDRAYPLNSLGVIAWKEKRYADAAHAFEQVRKVWIEAYGPGHPRVAMAAANVADMIALDGRYEEALVIYQETLEVREASLDAGHHFIAENRVDIAEVLIDLGRANEAISMVEKALAAVEGSTVAPLVIARARFTLARALGNAKRDHDRAEALAEQALQAYKDAGPAQTEEVERIEAWLRE